MTGRHAGGKSIERTAYFVMAAHCRHIEGGDTQPAARRLFYETIFFQKRHRLLYRLPRNAQLLRQLFLNEVSARQQLPIADIIEDRCVGTLGKAGLAVDNLHMHSEL